MDKWLTIGALDVTEWRSSLGGRWRRRAGRIIADGTGTGFGGRTLCYWQREVPNKPFDLTVTVKLDDEAGAAGLIFGGDGKDKHYGFYPTGSKLRLTRFDGPDVFSWKIIKDIPSDHYQPGEWNTLRVHVEADRFTCYVNGNKVVEQTEPDYAGSRVGLAKFRDTIAEFKKFQCADRIAANTLDAKMRAQIDKAMVDLVKAKEPTGDWLNQLLANPEASMNLLRDARGNWIKKRHAYAIWRRQVHERRCLDELAAELSKTDGQADLIRAALLVARLDNEDLDVTRVSRRG